MPGVDGLVSLIEQDSYYKKGLKNTPWDAPEALDHERLQEDLVKEMRRPKASWQNLPSEWLMKAVRVYLMVAATWRTLVILELIHASKPNLAEGFLEYRTSPGSAWSCGDS